MSAWESREGEDTSLGGSRVGGGVGSGLWGIGHQLLHNFCITSA